MGTLGNAGDPLWLIALLKKYMDHVAFLEGTPLLPVGGMTVEEQEFLAMLWRELQGQQP